MAISIDYLNKYLVNNPKDIITILEAAGFYHVSFFEYSNEIRCSWEEDGNKTAVCINVSNLLAIAFSKNIGGTLFTLLMQHNNWSMPKVLNFICNVLNIEKKSNDNDFFIFGGFYKNIHNFNVEKPTQSYSLNMLDNYICHPNTRFLKDGISLYTQYKFDIRYDNINNRIIVPWYDKNGELKGASGRYNFNNLGENPKWKAMLNFSKSQMLYGLYQNQKFIENNDTVIIGESEKFVMQLDSFGYNNALALGGCNISNIQARILKSLPVNKIVIALDEGLSLEHILNQADKLKGGIFNSTKEIYIIYNNDNSILPKGSKMSPTDKGKDNFELLLNNYCFKKE